MIRNFLKLYKSEIIMIILSVVLAWLIFSLWQVGHINADPEHIYKAIPKYNAIELVYNLFLK